MRKSECGTRKAKVRRWNAERKGKNELSVKSRRFFCHAGEGGYPVFSVTNFLDSCLRRNDSLFWDGFKQNKVKGQVLN